VCAEMAGTRGRMTNGLVMWELSHGVVWAAAGPERAQGPYQGLNYRTAGIHGSAGPGSLKIDHLFSRNGTGAKFESIAL
jgi:hypothetical protein